jgi:hypothetical protein
LPKDSALNDRVFMPRRSKGGKRVYGALILLLVLGGGLLQFQWMQHIRETGKTDMVPNVLAEKLSRWMMQKSGIPLEDSALSSDAQGIEKIVCETCMGTGRVLSGPGEKEICPICLGVGFHMVRRFDPADRICPLCAGMGRVERPDTGEVAVCPRCNGRGLVRSQMDSAPAGN